MENIMGKPLYPSASGGAVGSSPLKPTNPPIRERILGPFIRYPAVKNALGNKPISRPTLISVSSIEAELAEVRSAWGQYRSTNSRDAVYGYLKSVFTHVTRWRRLNCALGNSKAALRHRPNPPQMKPEPFGIVIFCTCDPEVADGSEAEVSLKKRGGKPEFEVKGLVTVRRVSELEPHTPHTEIWCKWSCTIPGLSLKDEVEELPFLTAVRPQREKAGHGRGQRRSSVRHEKGCRA